MPRNPKQYHYIYKTTNLINEKYYLGMHSTNNLNDGYMGSGNRIRRSIKKYGKENFKMEILEFQPDRCSLKEREKELVNIDLLTDSLCMNIMCGGEGGFISEEQQKYRSKCGGLAYSKKLKTDFQSFEKHSERSSKIMSKLHADGKIRIPNTTGLKHKESTKKLIGEKNSIYQKGEKNSQFGTYWITNGIENKKLKNNLEIPFGWYKGRKIT